MRTVDWRRRLVFALSRLCRSPCRWSPTRRRRCIRRFVGTGIAFLPDRYGPVTEPLLLGHLRRACRGRRSAPPCSPARGAEVEQLVGRRRSLRDRARRPAACCPGRAACAARRAAGGCRAGAGRSSARRARRARRTGRCRPGWPGECAALRRRRASAAGRPSVR